MAISNRDAAREARAKSLGIERAPAPAAAPTPLSALKSKGLKPKKNGEVELKTMPPGIDPEVLANTEGLELSNPEVPNEDIPIPEEQLNATAEALIAQNRGNLGSKLKVTSEAAFDPSFDSRLYAPEEIDTKAEFTAAMGNAPSPTPGFSRAVLDGPAPADDNAINRGIVVEKEVYQTARSEAMHLIQEMRHQNQQAIDSILAPSSASLSAPANRLGLEKFRSQKAVASGDSQAPIAPPPGRRESSSYRKTSLG